MFSFELFSKGKRKTEQSNRCMFNEYPNWSATKQSYCTIHREKFSVFARCLHQLVEAKMGSMTFGSLQKELLGARPLDFKELYF